MGSALEMIDDMMRDMRHDERVMRYSDMQALRGVIAREALVIPPAFSVREWHSWFLKALNFVRDSRSMDNIPRAALDTMQAILASARHPSAGATAVPLPRGDMPRSIATHDSDSDSLSRDFILSLCQQAGFDLDTPNYVQWKADATTIIPIGAMAVMLGFNVGKAAATREAEQINGKIGTPREHAMPLYRKPTITYNAAATYQAYNNYYHKIRAEVTFDQWDAIWKKALEWAAGGAALYDYKPEWVATATIRPGEPDFTGTISGLPGGDLDVTLAAGPGVDLRDAIGSAHLDMLDNVSITIEHSEADTSLALSGNLSDSLDRDLSASNWEVDRQPSQQETIIACLGDDAAQIRDAVNAMNGGEFIAVEWADNMDTAAELLGYAPLSMAEVRDLTTMLDGAPWGADDVQRLFELFQLAEKVRGMNKRPVDVAVMPPGYWDDEPGRPKEASPKFPFPSNVVIQPDTGAA